MFYVLLCKYLTGREKFNIINHIKEVCMSNFQKNLKSLTSRYTQKYIAECTGFSQASINNYLTKNSEPSIQFLIALKNAFGICVDDFLFGDVNIVNQESYDRFLGNYIVYYYNNNSYKGEVHVNLANTLNYGVISIVKGKDVKQAVEVFGVFVKNKTEAVEFFREINKLNDSSKIIDKYKSVENVYKGNISANEQSVFINLDNTFNGDKTLFIFNNPPSKNDYIGGVATVNSIARGREHNPCVQFAIFSKNIISKPDGEIYNYLKFDNYHVTIEHYIKEAVDLFKRLYVEKNEISGNLTETQKNTLIQNKLEYYLNEILDANIFRFAKISNREDDMIFKLIREETDV